MASEVSPEVEAGLGDNHVATTRAGPATTARSQAIARELAERQAKVLERWRCYRALLLFLGFFGLFLGVLYAQRQATQSFYVYRSTSPVLQPGSDLMQDKDAVYDWLQGVLNSVWKDPVCGDGVCEAPFEYAAYSRFGCKADCGKLNEIQNLTRIQIDFYYDFAHPIGSIPASDLLQQTSWNVCPVQTPFTDGCYFESDQTFDRLAGSTTLTLDDAPGGEWDLVIKRDIFSKVGGAVRDVTLLYASAYYTKVYIAVAAARAEQAYELLLLQQAIAASSVDFWSYANATLRPTYPSAEQWEADVGWVRNATCFCDVVANDTVNASAPAFGSAVLAYLNQSASYDNSSSRVSIDTTQHRADRRYCPTAYVPYIWTTDPADSSNGTRPIFSPVDPSNQTALHAWCSTGLNTSLTWRNNQTNAVRRLLIDQRLGDMRSTGKIGVRNAVNAALRDWIVANTPELLAPIYSLPSGTSAADDPVSARLEPLMTLYTEGLAGLTQPQRAFLNMTRRVVYGVNVHLLDLAPRAQARYLEVIQQAANVSSIAVPPPLSSYQNYTFLPTTVGAVYDSFIAAGATSSALPDPANATLGQFALPYNLIEWPGNRTAYLQCDLQKRAPEYVGTCVDMNVTCTAQPSNATVPYICTDVLLGGVAIGGDMSISDYRARCEMPCERRLDCATVCECYGGCGAGQYCECAACAALNSNAALDAEFVDVRIAVPSQATSIAALNAAGVSSATRHHHHLHRHQHRSLQQVDPAVQSALSGVVTRVVEVARAQNATAAQLAVMKAQVDRANALADARAADSRVLDQVAFTQADISAGKARSDAKLAEIIGKQKQALALAEAAGKTIGAIQGLAAMQQSALASLEQRLFTEMANIRVATTGGVLTLQQALVLWKRARRDKALVTKATKLSNLPCNSQPTASNSFTLVDGTGNQTSAARYRYVGLTNRVVGGMLLHQVRTNETLCPDSKFNKIQKTCTGPRTLASYGVDPVFKRGTTLYDPDMEDADYTKVVSIYNCSLLSAPTYNVSFLNTTVNPPPYCAELFNPQAVPYAFHHFPLRGKPDGFPVWFDINLSQEGAQAWFDYLREGLFLDSNTLRATAEAVTYNAALRIFTYTHLAFTFTDGGSIRVKSRLSTLRVELYDSGADAVRYGFEILWSMAVCLLVLQNLHKMYKAHKETGNFLRYFLSGWHWLMVVSNGLLLAVMIMWWVIANNYATQFDIGIRFPVYKALSPPANFLALEAEGAGLAAANAAIGQLRELADLLNWYFFLNGFNIVLLVARMLHLMDFQPRLGVVTRSLVLAGPDLTHFGIVAGVVFLGYAMMGTLIFGNAVEAFSTFANSVNTCFEILLGVIDVNEDLKALGGLQSVAGALFFWSYELLVYMVLLNFLLAIIVDAFSEVKEKTHETVGIHTELLQLCRDKAYAAWTLLWPPARAERMGPARLQALLAAWAREERTEGGGVAGEAAVKQKLLTILNEDLDEDTLKDVLRECIKEAPHLPRTYSLDPNDHTWRARFRRLFHRRDAAAVAGPEAAERQLALAAHYIVERFGAVPEDDDSDDEGREGEDVAFRGGEGEGGGEGGAEGGAGVEEAAPEPDPLALALQGLVEVQRQLAEGHRQLMATQRGLAEGQHEMLRALMQPPR
ncbi:hypothetical protein HYH03_002630 [Edaphochlamys debaryana]|uniref:Polycystin cation channel PKD1/PKD2 domain-containing protein n=1 Tax=Edaphochlamys debaryana TaxID=47281 RepID=A0A835YB31_9CHLO|nr:hypothetical protein HYH03_002630 [Edaphochlamys debaryana]|eukprot:KAG2499695.1 hypothetical protein HYH03_002630 [Edaphochlamys debaryana]